MNRAYLVVPIVGLAAFAAYFVHWKTNSPPADRPEVRLVDAYADRDGREEA